MEESKDKSLRVREECRHSMLHIKLITRDREAWAEVRGRRVKTKTRFQKLKRRKVIVEWDRVGVGSVVIVGEDVSAIYFIFFKYFFLL